MIDQYISDKIKVMSFFCIIVVLYIHSDFHETADEIAGMMANLCLQTVGSRFVGAMAVPLFFMISGCLFFVHADTIGDVWRKMRRRVRTLLIPYVIWALLVPSAEPDRCRCQD